jgi:hypothetical protein
MKMKPNLLTVLQLVDYCCSLSKGGLACVEKTILFLYTSQLKFQHKTQRDTYLRNAAFVVSKAATSQKSHPSCLSSHQFHFSY